MITVLKRVGRLPEIYDVDITKQRISEAINATRVKPCLTMDTPDGCVGVALCSADEPRNWAVNFFAPSDGSIVQGDVIVVKTKPFALGDTFDAQDLHADDAAFWMWLMSFLYFRAIETPLGGDVARQVHEVSQTFTPVARRSFVGADREIEITEPMRAQLQSEYYREMAARVVVVHQFAVTSSERGIGSPAIKV